MNMSGAIEEYDHGIYVEDETTYYVEKILKRRKRKRKYEYLVKWQGYPDVHNSWVFQFDITPDLKNDFNGKLLGRKRKRTSSKTSKQSKIDPPLTAQSKVTSTPDGIPKKIPPSMSPTKTSKSSLRSAKSGTDKSPLSGTIDEMKTDEDLELNSVTDLSEQSSTQRLSLFYDTSTATNDTSC